MTRRGAGPESGRGVWKVPHVYPDGAVRIYAADSAGRIVAERVVSPEFMASATVELEDLLDRVDPVEPVQPRPALRLLR
ncbi:MAG TPA: hypothetical protein VIL18_06925 [Longimicrobiales bacterium]